jgi:hypothetical protein
MSPMHGRSEGGSHRSSEHGGYPMSTPGHSQVRSPERIVRRVVR